MKKSVLMFSLLYTFCVGEVAPEVKNLLKTTKESLYQGIQQAVEVKRVGDVSHAVQTYCESKGYSVVRELEGHGIGRKMHEEPEVPNYGRYGCGALLRLNNRNRILTKGIDTLDFRFVKRRDLNRIRDDWYSGLSNR